MNQLNLLSVIPALLVPLLKQQLKCIRIKSCSILTNVPNVNVFLNPRVSLDVLQNYYTSHYLPYGDQKRGVSLKISGKQPAKVRFKRVKRVKGVHVISESLILDVGCGNPSF
jgi:hypothetical protein